MARMTKEEAIKYLERYRPQCPACKLIAARIIIRFPTGVKPETLDNAERILWSYTGKERHI